MNPARSVTATGVLPRSRDSRASVSAVSGEVSTVEITSTSFMTGAGLKKCSPATRAGSRVPPAISVTDSEEVLVARIASARQASSSWANRVFLSSMRSGMASITRSASATPVATSSVGRIRASISSRAVSVSLPRLTALSREARTRAMPWSRKPWFISIASTLRPLRAISSAMPEPIRPSPITATSRMSPGWVTLLVMLVRLSSHGRARIGDDQVWAGAQTWSSARPGSDPLEDRGDALPAADAHRVERVPAAGALELVQRLDDQDGAGGADRVAERDPAAVRVDALGGQVQFPGHGQCLGGEGLVDLEHVDLVDLEAGAVEHLARRGYRAHAHDPRLDSRVTVTDHPAERGEAVAVHERSRGEHHGRGGIVEAGRVARGDRAVLRERGPQPGHVIQADVRPYVLVGVDDGGLALPAGDLDRQHLLLE